MDSNGETNNPRGLGMLIRVEQAISAALVLTILGLVAVQMAARYFLRSPFTWTEEAARFGLIWLTFIGAAFVMAKGRHIAVDVVSQPLGPRARMALDIVSLLITIVASAMLLPASFSFTVVMGGVGSPAAGIPMSVVYSAGLFGFSLLALHCLFRLIIALRSGPAMYADEDIVEHIAGTDSA